MDDGRGGEEGAGVLAQDESQDYQQQGHDRSDEPDALHVAEDVTVSPRAFGRDSSLGPGWEGLCDRWRLCSRGLSDCCFISGCL